MAKKQTAEAVSTPPKQAVSTPPKKAKKRKAKAKKLPDPAGRPEALLGKRFTHRKRTEWGVGTVVGGAENLLVLSWSDGAERRTARTYMDQLIEAP